MKISGLCMIVALAVAAVFLGGCMQAFAWTAAQFAPPRKAKPVFEIPKDQIVLVYVDSESPLSYEPIKNMLTDVLNKELVANNIARSTISRDRLLDTLSDSQYASASKLEVGRKLGADLVLCVSVDQFSVRESDDSPLWTGRMKVNVRVLDVHKVKKIWPGDQPEYLLPLVELPAVADSSPTYGNNVAAALAIKTGRRIAKLFYEHTIPNTGPED